MCGPQLKAKWNSGERFSICRRQNGVSEECRELSDKIILLHKKELDNK